MSTEPDRQRSGFVLFGVAVCVVVGVCLGVRVGVSVTVGLLVGSEYADQTQVFIVADDPKSGARAELAYRINR